MGCNECLLIPGLTRWLLANSFGRRSINEWENEAGEFELRILINIQTPLTRGHGERYGGKRLPKYFLCVWRQPLSFFSLQPILKGNGWMLGDFTSILRELNVASLQWISFQFGRMVTSIDKRYDVIKLK